MGRPRGQTRNRVVAAALESLKSNGYGGSSTRAIAVIGGFNPALIFYYFDSLEDLLVAALAHSSQERLERYRNAVEEADNVGALLDVMGRIYAEDVESGHIRVVSEMVGASVANRDLAPRVLELMQPWLDLAERGVSDALRGTPFEELLPPRAAALAAVTFYLGANLLTHLQDEFADVAMLLEVARRYAPLLDADGA